MRGEVAVKGYSNDNVHQLENLFSLKGRIQGKRVNTALRELEKEM
jgi:hypothetical protein